MQNTEYLIIGQGIAGILTAFMLLEQGKDICVIDEEINNNASKMAGAMLNPVNLNTGKSFPNQLEDFDLAIGVYRRLEQLLNISTLDQCPILTFSTQNSLTLDNNISHCSSQQQKWMAEHFYNAQNCYLIKKAFHIHFPKLKSAWKQFLIKRNCWLDEKFKYSYCHIDAKSVVYKNIKAQKMIFCEGTTGKDNPFFLNLPFVPNLGNILHLNIDRLSSEYAYHSGGKKLIPLGNHSFWMGSNYVWNFESVAPNPLWKEEQIQFLKRYLKIPFTIQAHLAAERPCTAGQKPIQSQHKIYQNLYFLNGFGTRGFSRGPTLVNSFLKQFSLT